MDFLHLIKTARSCRRFVESEPLAPGTLEHLVECARLAPSAGNKQPLRYAIVEQPSMCARIFPALRWAGALPQWGGPIAGERPTGYIAILSGSADTSLLTRIDLGIAGQTIQLGASAQGLACCMFLSFNPQNVVTALNIPEAWKVDLMVAVGKPLEERRIAPMPAEGSAPYWRDEHQVHIVPKRSLEDCILVRS